MILKTNRGLLKLIIFSLLTFGIYALVFFTCLGDDLNTLASNRDGKRTMNFCLLAFIVAPITFGIASIVWYHKMSNRIGDELAARGINYRFTASDFWLWYVLGSFILIGPFVYLHKLCKSMNMLSENYNANRA